MDTVNFNTFIPEGFVYTEVMEHFEMHRIYMLRNENEFFSVNSVFETLTTVNVFHF